MARAAEPHSGEPNEAADARGTPMAEVTGPILTTSTSHPFTVGGTDLAAHGYTLAEYFVGGRANVYDWGTDGNALAPQVRTPNAPYTTRIVVRRPTDPGRSSTGFGRPWA